MKKQLAESFNERDGFVCERIPLGEGIVYSAIGGLVGAVVLGVGYHAADLYLNSYSASADQSPQVTQVIEPSQPRPGRN